MVLIYTQSQKLISDMTKSVDVTRKLTKEVHCTDLFLRNNKAAH